MESYTIQTHEGAELGPLTLEQVEMLIKQKRIFPASMVFTQSNNRWHLAASLPEVRELLRKHHPSLNRIINRIRKTDHGIGVTKSRVLKPSSSHPSISKSRKHSASEAPAFQPSPVFNPGNERYIIRAGDGVEYGPATYEEVKELVKQGRVKATTMVFTKSTNHWHLAASVQEVRALLRTYNPAQDSTLNRIRPHDSTLALMAHARISRIRVKHPFWKRLFFR